jgi:hypothetical protein
MHKEPVNVFRVNRGHLNYHKNTIHVSTKDNPLCKRCHPLLSNEKELSISPQDA